MATDHHFQFLIRGGTQDVVNIFQDAAFFFCVSIGKTVVERIQVMDAVIEGIYGQSLQKYLKFFYFFRSDASMNSFRVFISASGVLGKTVMPVVVIRCGCT